MDAPLKFGLGLNTNERLQSIVEKSLASESNGLDYVWIADRPDQLYAPVVASKVASSTRKIRIGIGLMSVLLHAPRHLAMTMDVLYNAYGDRFDLCIGVGDVQQLKRAGVHVDGLRDAPYRVLEARRKIALLLRRRRIKTQIWLGAQGPKMLELAESFDGVLLNYSRPAMIQWAITKAHPKRKDGERIGIYSPSYIYARAQPDILRLARISSSVVSLGAPRTVLKRFGLYDRLRRAKEILDSGAEIDSILDIVPEEITEEFSVTMQARELPAYLAELRRLRVSDVVFAYPQSYSLDTVGDLNQAIGLGSLPAH